jgi:hypothetical protein
MTRTIARSAFCTLTRVRGEQHRLLICAGLFCEGGPCPGEVPGGRGIGEHAGEVACGQLPTLGGVLPAGAITCAPCHSDFQPV